MLSRVAENIYWMARCIERAENTARLLNVNTNLILDLPHNANGWAPLIEITGSEEIFAEHYDGPDEKNVLRFLILDPLNPGAIVSSLQYARENARTIRDIIPRETWERLNNMFLDAKKHAQSGIARKHRYEYLHAVILGAQTITGQLAGTLIHDEGYDFLRMGRNLERADMTTRIIDVRSGDLPGSEHENLTPYENIKWMSVLKSLSAYQMYRRAIQVRVRRPDVLKFLFKERKFPRALYHTLCEVESCLVHLPRNEGIRELLHDFQEIVLDVDQAGLKQHDLHEFIDTLQLRLIEIHNEITTVYFRSHIDASTQKAVSLSAEDK